MLVSPEETQEKRQGRREPESRKNSVLQAGMPSPKTWGLGSENRPFTGSAFQGEVAIMGWPVPGPPEAVSSCPLYINYYLL